MASDHVIVILYRFGTKITPRNKQEKPTNSETKVDDVLENFLGLANFNANLLNILAYSQLI